MTKGMYHYIKEAWKNPSPDEVRKRLAEWRKENAITRIEKPTRLDRARNLGYKAKPGFVVLRVRVLRGGRTKSRPMGGRRSKRTGRSKLLQQTYQWVAEQRASRRYRNLEVLNSYWVGKDGMNYFYEVILVDPSHPQIKNSEMKWTSEPQHRGRAFRGLTSSAKKSRRE